MSVEKILDRVKKMLALANDAGATEGERDNAMRMAYNLLARSTTAGTTERPCRSTSKLAAAPATLSACNNSQYQYTGEAAIAAPAGPMCPATTEERI